MLIYFLNGQITRNMVFQTPIYLIIKPVSWSEHSINIRWSIMEYRNALGHNQNVLGHCWNELGTYMNALWPLEALSGGESVGMLRIKKPMIILQETTLNTLKTPLLAQGTLLVKRWSWRIRSTSINMMVPLEDALLD